MEHRHWRSTHVKDSTERWGESRTRLAVDKLDDGEAD